MIITPTQLDEAAEALRSQQLEGIHIQPWMRLPESAKHTWRMAVKVILQRLRITIEGDNGVGSE